jgi:Raf kinase inhibitor-like YbhB/YbcL family protein
MSRNKHPARPERPESKLNFTSNSLKNSNKFDLKYVCKAYGGEDKSPHLKWDAIDGAESYLLLMDDPDAKVPGGWVHWLVPYIPADVTSLPSGDPPNKETYKVKTKTLRQGINSWGCFGYGGPCPPNDGHPHRYHIRLYALKTSLKDAKLNGCMGLTREMCMALIRGNVLDKAEMIKKFQHPEGTPPPNKKNNKNNKNKNKSNNKKN